MKHVQWMRRVLAVVVGSALLLGIAHAAAPQVKTQARVDTSVNGCLIDTGTRLVLIDTDRKNVAIQRKRADADAAKHGTLVGPAHLSLPGLGHLRAEGKGYAWVPLNCGGLK